MSEVIRLRCSALPLAFKCAGSVRQSELPINDTNPQAEAGTAAHAALRALVELGRADWDAVPELARKHGVPEVEIRVLLALATKLWALVKDSFPCAETEAEGELEGDGYVLTGHVDIIARVGDTARIADWKGGRLDSDYREQLLGYAALALTGDDTLTDAEAGILWIREGDYEPYRLRRSELAAWEERLLEEVVRWNGTYRPGPHCAHCRRNHECPAALALVRRDVAAVTDDELMARIEDPDVLASMPVNDVIDVLTKADMVTRYAKRVRDAIKAHVRRSGGELSDGKRRLVIVQEETRELDPQAAIPVLQGFSFEGTPIEFDNDDLAGLINMSAAKAEEVVKSRAPKRKGAAAVRELQAKLDAAGAIRVSSFSKLVTRRA